MVQKVANKPGGLFDSLKFSHYYRIVDNDLKVDERVYRGEMLEEKVLKAVQVDGRKLGVVEKGL